jgi:hypothetical protein
MACEQMSNMMAMVVCSETTCQMRCLGGGSGLLDLQQANAPYAAVDELVNVERSDAY